MVKTPPTSRLVIALGANLGDPEATFRRAIELIDSRVGAIVSTSKFRRTEAVSLPGQKQPKYLNAAVLVDTKNSPTRVLELLLQIETELGRIREPEQKWQPRIIDLDLICYEDQVLDSPQLTLPHPEMHKRPFVLEPLCELWPDWVHPILNKEAMQLREVCIK